MKTATRPYLSKPASAAILGAAALGCLWPAVSGAEAITLGAIVGLAGANEWADFTGPLAPHLLRISVVGLGASMNLAAVWAVGAGSIGYTVLGIGVTFALGLWMGRRARLGRDQSLLLTSGTAICGGSAIAAVACVLKPRQEDTTAALATVFMLNAVGLLIFPALGHLLGLGQHQFGLWAALAIHDTSSVVGAGASYGEEALRVATTVKLARALWIVPVALVIGWATSRNSPDRSPGRFALPWFIAGFLVVAALVTYVPSLAASGEIVASVAKRVLVVALFFIGANLSLPMLRAVGWRPLAVGAILWTCISILTVGAILAGWIR